MDDPTKNPNEQGFVMMLVEKTPSWAVGSLGTLLTLALVLKIIGIDFSGPINDVTEAYTSAIIAQAEGLSDFREASERLEAVIDSQRRSQLEMSARMEQVFAEQTKQINDISAIVEEVSTNVLILEDRINRFEARLEALEETHLGE